MEILGYASLGLLFTRYYTPIQGYKAKLVEKYINYTIRKGWFNLSKLSLFLTCPKCFTLLFTLIYTHNIFTSMEAAVLAMVIDLTIKYLQNEHK